MTFAVNNVGKNAQFEKDPVMFSFTTTDGASFSGNVHSYPVNTWTTQTINFALASETEGTIKIGYKAGNTGSGNTPKLVVDYVKAMYNSNYTATLQSAIDRATILNARASDSDLATAITTAQGVLDGADNTVAYQETINSAVTTLRSAITTAAAKVVLLEGENVTFMFENADFESGTPVTVGITTYDYDAATNGTHYSRMQVVEGWTIGENGNAKSAGLYKFDENPFLGSTGASYQAPASGSATGENQALGIVAVWSSIAQYKQACTLPAGSYIIEVPVYNTAGTTAFNKNLIGFVEDGGTEHLATAKTYETGRWIAEKVIFELENETSGYLSLGYKAEHKGSGDMPHLFIDGVKVTYTSPIAAAYQKYQDALDTANDAIGNSDYENVTGNERAALQSAIDATPEATKDAYNSAADALDAAREAFTAAKTNYDALVAAKATVVPDLAYATTAKKAALTDAIAATASTSEEAATKTAAIITALRAYYESNAMAEGVATAVDYSTAVSAANADTNTGWTNGVGTKSEQSYTNADGTTATKYLDGGWASNAPANVDMTRTVEIPAGTYLLTVKARGAIDLTTYTLSIAGKTINLPHANGGSNGVFGNGWEDASVEFESDGTAQTLEVIAQSTANQQWFSMNNFRLIQLSLNEDAYAGTTEYTALNDAIDAAEAKTLGFDEGEYAPYNNVEALTKLAEANAIDQKASLTNLKTTVNALTTYLNDDANWTANNSEVNAIYNGNFALSTANETSGLDLDIPGWTPNGNIRQVIENDVNGTFPALAETTGGKAMFTWDGTFVYGEQSGYELPLNAHTIYELSFKHAGWNGSNNNFYVKVTDDEGAVLPQQTCGKSNNGPQTAGCWNTYTIIFVTGNGGNHKLSMIPSGNSAFTDVTLYKADSQTLTFAEDGSTPKFAAGTYPTVALDREFSTKKRSTMVLPFALTADETSAAFEEVYELDAVEGQSIKLAEATEIAAGKPYLVKAKNTTLSVSGKALDPSTTVSNTEKSDASSTVTFVGRFSPVVLTAADNGNAYVVSNSTLYQVTSNVNVNAYRGYFTVDTTGGVGVKNFVLDFGNGETTSIEALESETRDKVIYNLAGQRVQKAQKGIFIVNGKKVVIK